MWPCSFVILFLYKPHTNFHSLQKETFHMHSIEVDDAKVVSLTAEFYQSLEVIV